MLPLVRKYPQLKTPLLVLGLYLLIGGIIFSIVSKPDQVKVSEKEQRVPDDSAEIHPARTYLVVDNGFSELEYYVRLDTTDTFFTMLDYHRENSSLTYERVGYVYGTGLDSINGYDAPEGFVWKVYNNDEEINTELKALRVENEHTYKIKLEPLE